MTDAPKYRMRLVHAHMDYITAEISKVDSMIEKLITSGMLSNYFVPFRVLNMIVLSPSSPRLILTQSSSQIPSVYVARPTLLQAAMNPQVRRNLLRSHVPKSASNLHWCSALTQPSNLLTAVYQMLSTGKQQNLSDIYKIDMPVAFVEKQKAKAIKQAKKLLLGEGILSESQLVSQTPVSNMYSFLNAIL